MSFLAAGAIVGGFYDFPIYLLICKAEAIVLPSFRIAVDFDSWFFMFCLDL